MPLLVSDASFSAVPDNVPVNVTGKTSALSIISTLIVFVAFWVKSIPESETNIFAVISIPPEGTWLDWGIKCNPLIIGSFIELMSEKV